jgi:hypothetical protein
MGTRHPRGFDKGGGGCLGGAAYTAFMIALSNTSRYHHTNALFGGPISNHLDIVIQMGEGVFSPQEVGGGGTALFFAPWWGLDSGGWYHPPFLWK